MAFFDCHFFSDTLGLTVSAYVLLPQTTSRQIGLAGAAGSGRTRKFPTLTLLHGLSDDHTIWLRRTSIERYAAQRGLAVVMPAVGRSFYQDTQAGGRYWTYLSEELPAVLRGFFPLSEKREENFVAGLSMGGYGALRLALAQPGRYAAAASLSGALDVGRICRTAGRPGSRLTRAEVEDLFGRELRAEGSEADLAFLARRLSRSRQPRPQLYLSCGTEDGLLAENRAFRDMLAKLKLAPTYHEPPGDHEWGLWDAEIRRVLEWLPLPD